MKTGIVLAAAFALASFPLVAQMPAGDNPQQSNPAAQPSNPQGTVPPAAQPDQPGSRPEETAPGQPSTPTNPSAAAESSAAPATAAAEMRPVSGELVNKLDTKTAKTGDDVVVQTKSAVKTADGTDIPKGSKLMGHVVAVQASTGDQNSQVALQFDHAELAGGKSLPIQTQIQSIGSADAGAGASEPGQSPMSRSANPGASGTPGNSPNGAGAGAGSAAGAAESAQAASPGGAGTTSHEVPAGTVVARNGKIAIQATSIPGVLLANNAPGEQDPRMARASSILLGARKDVQLESGTPVVLNVSTAGSAAGETK